MIILDTSVVSLYLRRAPKPEPPHPAARGLDRLLDSAETLAIPGTVFQEALSGLRSEAQFQRLRDYLLGGFRLILAEIRDHLSAAQIFNRCRSQGVAASAGDCLIAAQTIHADGELFTVDRDFFRMARHCDLKLLNWEGQAS